MKRKVIVSIIIGLLILSESVCIVCANSSETEINEKTKENLETEIWEEDSNGDNLNEAVEYIKDAEEAISAVAATQLKHWTTSSSIIQYYFDDDIYMDAFGSDEKELAENIHEYREDATNKLSEAKDLIGTEGTGDFYDSVKDYYLIVNDYLSLISTFPSGYSKLTFSNTVSDFNNECKSAYNEIEFYF